MSDRERLLAAPVALAQHRRAMDASSLPGDDDAYNAGEALLAAAAARGERTLLRCAGRGVSGRALRESALAAERLVRAHGAANGERVLLALHDSPAFVAAFLGALRAGALPVPINTQLSREAAAFIARDADVRLAFVEPELEDTLAESPALPRVRARGGALEAPPSRASEVAPCAATRARDPAFLLYTSGTTGAPKGVVHRHADLAVTAAHYGSGVLGLNARDRVLSGSKLFFAYGLGNSLTFPLLLGCECVLHPARTTPEAMFALLRDEAPSVFFGVPTLYAAMLAHPALPESLGSVRLCVSAGEALPAALAERWRARFGVELLDGLGSTEMLHVFVSNRPGESRPGSSGVAVPGYEVRVVDEAGADTAPGEIGALLARGASAARSYHGRPEETARTMFAPGWLRTGDSYRRDADGFLWHVGRSDDLFKASGQWISPVEVEAALCAHAAVVEAAVVAHAGADGLVKPRAFATLARGHAASEALAEELRAFARERLAPHKVPREVAFVDELPKTATGKIQRHLLREKRA